MTTPQNNETAGGINIGPHGFSETDNLIGNRALKNLIKLITDQAVVTNQVLLYLKTMKANANLEEDYSGEAQDILKKIIAKSSSGPKKDPYEGYTDDEIEILKRQEELLKQQKIENAEAELLEAEKKKNDEAAKRLVKAYGNKIKGWFTSQNAMMKDFVDGGNMIVAHSSLLSGIASVTSKLVKTRMSAAEAFMRSLQQQGISKADTFFLTDAEGKVINKGLSKADVALLTANDPSLSGYSEYTRNGKTLTPDEAIGILEDTHESLGGFIKANRLKTNVFSENFEQFMKQTQEEREKAADNLKTEKTQEAIEQRLEAEHNISLLEVLSGLSAATGKMLGSSALKALGGLTSAFLEGKNPLNMFVNWLGGLTWTALLSALTGPFMSGIGGALVSAMPAILAVVMTAAIFGAIGYIVGKWLAPHIATFYDWVTDAKGKLEVEKTASERANQRRLEARLRLSNRLRYLREAGTSPLELEKHFAKAQVEEARINVEEYQIAEILRIIKKDIDREDYDTEKEYQFALSHAKWKGKRFKDIEKMSYAERYKFFVEKHGGGWAGYTKEYLLMLKNLKERQQVALNLGIVKPDEGIKPIEPDKNATGEELYGQAMARGSKPREWIIAPGTVLRFTPGIDRSPETSERVFEKTADRAITWIRGAKIPFETKSSAIEMIGNLRQGMNTEKDLDKMMLELINIFKRDKTNAKLVEQFNSWRRSGPGAMNLKFEAEVEVKDINVLKQ
jgi:hypothetical protein